MIKRVVSGAAATVVAAGLMTVVQPTSTAESRDISRPLAAVASNVKTARISVGVRAEQYATTRIGRPYRWGATGPNAFDCSGLIVWSFKKAGRNLPRVADAQMRSSRLARVSAKSAKKGHLVFFLSRSGHATHVGIVTGKGRMVAASSSAGKVRRQSIYSSRVAYRRVK